MLLRMIACHPLLLSSIYSTDNYRHANFNKEGDTVLQLDLQAIQTYKNLVKDSGKMEYFDQMLDKLL